MKKFELQPLPYAYDALEPVIDAKTMEIHFTKHHQTYVNNLNAALEKHPTLDYPCIGSLLADIENMPSDIQTAVRNNGGGHANHALFWSILTPQNSSELSGEIKEAIAETFGSFDEFKTLFKQTATTRFGSGWAWLVVTPNKELKVYSTPNQDSPRMEGNFPILGLDVWEHAYYLNYQNRRADYIENFFSIINWQEVNRRYLKALDKSC